MKPITYSKIGSPTTKKNGKNTSVNAKLIYSKIYLKTGDVSYICLSKLYIAFMIDMNESSYMFIDNAKIFMNPEEILVIVCPILAIIPTAIASAVISSPLDLPNFILMNGSDYLTTQDMVDETKVT